MLKQNTNKDISALLRDFEAHNLDKGRALAAEMGLTNVRFEQGDAFDADAIRAVQPRPNLVIVSGLYELFPDNQIVGTSLQGIGDLVAPGGYLSIQDNPGTPKLK